jgi:hypothetical protein
VRKEKIKMQTSYCKISKNIAGNVQQGEESYDCHQISATWPAYIQKNRQSVQASLGRW